MAHPKYLSLIALCLLSNAGCGSRLQPAGGTVSVDGIPLEQGVIMFYPTVSGRTAMGAIVSGSFSLSFEKQGDGLPVGEYKVTIVGEVWKETKGKTKAQELEEAMAKKSGAIDTSSAPAGEMVYVVPVIYGAIATTPLTQSVKFSSTPEKYVFNIVTKKK
jgi:hypothetical protein